MTERLLDQALESGGLRALDVHFAYWMGRFAGSDEPALLLASALVSSRVGEGDVCADLARFAEQRLFAGDGAVGPVAPPLASWRETLRSCNVVGAPGDVTPLILDESDRLYLARYWRFESDLSAALMGRASAWVNEVDRQRLRLALDRLFPRSNDIDWQKVAAAMAVLKPFCVISGGPGTGKTRTVTAILALLIDQANGSPLRIALAAPTGKAAARLTESIAAARVQLGLSEEVIQAIPGTAFTLHRLLGFRPGRSNPRHGPDDPLHLDVVVVDEASMVDLPLMSRLLAALHKDARLILLGDKDQLASVEAGMVLGDICGRGRETGYSRDLCDALREVAGAKIKPARGAEASVADHTVVLRKSYRFGEQSGIGALARAVNVGEGEQAIALLASFDCPDISQVTSSATELAAYVHDFVLSQYRTYLEANDLKMALAWFKRFRVLCAVRRGPYGVYALNRLIENALAASGLIRTDTDFYPGRPLMVTQNDYGQGLFNGDIGLVFEDPENGGALRVFFETTDGMRRVLPSRLPQHETAYAMTVHKSQGSEFDELLLVLPEGDSRILTRELLYTGITRAKSRVTVLADEAAIRHAANLTVTRSSGLFDRLWKQDAPESRNF